MLPKLEKLLECPICFDTLSMPIAICQENGHAICRNCKKSVGSCPFCKSEWSRGRHIFLEEILNVLLERCKHCTKYVDMSKLEEHERRACKKKIMQCFIFSRAGRCLYTFRREELINHLYNKHGRKLYSIYLDECVYVPIRNVFFTKNFSVLFKVCFPSGNQPGFFILLRVYCDKMRRLFCFSLNIIEGDGEISEEFVYEFTIKRGHSQTLHSFLGPCIRVCDIPESPDRYPGGHEAGRIVVSKRSPMFSDPNHHLLEFFLEMRRP